MCMGGRSANPLCVATCAVNYCTTRASISLLFYPQLLATKEMTWRHTAGLYVGDGMSMVMLPGPCTASAVYAPRAADTTQHRSVSSSLCRSIAVHAPLTRDHTCWTIGYRA